MFMSSRTSSPVARLTGTPCFIRRRRSLSCATLIFDDVGAASGSNGFLLNSTSIVSKKPAVCFTAGILPPAPTLPASPGLNVMVSFLYSALNAKNTSANPFTAKAAPGNISRFNRSSSSLNSARRRIESTSIEGGAVPAVPANPDTKAGTNILPPRPMMSCNDFALSNAPPAFSTALAICRNISSGVLLLICCIDMPNASNART